MQREANENGDADGEGSHDTILPDAPAEVRFHFIFQACKSAVLLCVFVPGVPVTHLLIQWYYDSGSISAVRACAWCTRDPSAMLL